MRRIFPYDASFYYFYRSINLLKPADMKKTGVIILIIVVLVIWGVSKYNGFVQKDEDVKTAWSQVENQYKRRADLIPQLVNTVKGYTKHESSTLQSVIEARTKATQITVDPDNLTPEKIQEYQKAQGEIGTALGRLLAITENYPDLKANENFLQLQSQLEGTENRISVERKKYNDAANDYNKTIRTFPNNLISGIFGFERHELFQATEQEKAVPNVQF